MLWDVSEQPPRKKRCAWLNSPPCLNLSVSNLQRYDQLCEIHTPFFFFFSLTPTYYYVCSLAALGLRLKCASFRSALRSALRPSQTDADMRNSQADYDYALASNPNVRNRVKPASVKTSPGKPSTGAKKTQKTQAKKGKKRRKRKNDEYDSSEVEDYDDEDSAKEEEEEGAANDFFSSYSNNDLSCLDQPPQFQRSSSFTEAVRATSVSILNYFLRANSTSQDASNSNSNGNSNGSSKTTTPTSSQSAEQRRVGGLAGLQRVGTSDVLVDDAIAQTPFALLSSMSWGGAGNQVGGLDDDGDDSNEENNDGAALFVNATNNFVNVKAAYKENPPARKKGKRI